MSGHCETGVDSVVHVSSIDTAYDLLKRKGRPMHYTDIADNVLEVVKLGGATPQYTILVGMIKDPRFYRYGKGTYGLTEWLKKR